MYGPFKRTKEQTILKPCFLLDLWNSGSRGTHGSTRKLESEATGVGFRVVSDLKKKKAQ